MEVYKYISNKLEQGGKLHFSLLDPEKFTPEKAGDVAGKLEKFGTDAIMLGGSTTGTIDEVAKAVKENVSIPVILFPNSATSLTKHADAVFFMSLLNSNKRRFIIEEQVKGAPKMEELGLEPLSMAYLVVNTGRRTAVEQVADVIKLSKEALVDYALAAQYMGMRLVYLEAGSGAENSVPNEMIKAVKEKIDLPVIVGGGVRGPNTAREKLEAGADIIVIGSVIEKAYGKVPEIIDVVKNFKVQE